MNSYIPCIIRLNDLYTLYTTRLDKLYTCESRRTTSCTALASAGHVSKSNTGLTPVATDARSARMIDGSKLNANDFTDRDDDREDNWRYRLDGRTTTD